MKNENQNINQEQEALRKIAPTLFSMEKRNNFSIPEGYFEQLFDQIDKKVNQSQSVPEDYFSNFADRLMDRIEEEDLAPTLFGIEKKNNFKIPEGYFDQLPEKIAENLQDNKETKVIPLQQRSTLRILSTISGIAAAVIMGFFIFQSDKGEAVILEQDSFANLTVGEFEEVLTMEDDEDDLLAMVDFEMENYEDVADEASDNINFTEEVDFDFTSEEVEDYFSSESEFELEF